ncbi:hypothetical protein CRENBAI_011637, partial [Crenichthys baileyi]
IGQIYEAYKSMKKQSLDQQAEWTKYPELSKDLIIEGHLMELMDGVSELHTRGHLHRYGDEGKMRHL